MDAHKDAVATIAAKVQEFYDRREKFRIYHGETNSTRPQYFRRNNTIDVSRLDHVLSVDERSKTAIVEPNVAMDKLVHSTLDYGLIPPVVMELPGITVAGGFSGTSGESSSFRYGLFEQTIRSFEMVLANGDIVNASASKKEDLFYGAAGAFGTLGVITLLEISLIDAKKYVELTFCPLQSVPKTLEKIEEAVSENPSSYDFVDGIVFSETRALVMLGRFSNGHGEPGLPVRRFSRAQDPWFYLHAKGTLERRPEPTTELVDLVDYLFRWDRGAFWGGLYAFQYFLTPCNSFTRWLLDPLLHTRTMYHALHKSGLADQYIVQDCVFPASTVSEFIRYCGHDLGIYPLWLCPIAKGPLFSKHPHASAVRDNNPSTRRDWLLNVGVWGPGPKDYSSFVSLNREIEEKVRGLGGVKTLYAHSYYTEEEFNSIYDRKQYDALRKKYHATTLPSVYEKIRVDPHARTALVRSLKAIWPLGGIYGALRATSGGDYMFARESPAFAVIAIVVALVAILGMSAIRDSWS